jgi:hypothetical protein
LYQNDTAMRNTADVKGGKPITVLSQSQYKVSGTSPDLGTNMDISLNQHDYHFLFPTLISLRGVGTTCFSSCCDKDSVFIDYDLPPA